MNCHVLPPTIALSSGYPTSSCIATLSGVLHWLFTAVRTRPSSLSLGYRTLVWVLPVSLGPSPAWQALPDLEAPSDPLCCQQVTAIPVEMFPIMASPDSLLASPDSFFPHRVELKDPVVSRQQHTQPGQGGPTRWRIVSECHWVFVATFSVSKLFLGTCVMGIIGPSAWSLSSQRITLPFS